MVALFAENCVYSRDILFDAIFIWYILFLSNHFISDVAERVFYRCVVNNGLPLEHPDYEITCNYEFLEDVNTDWGQDLVQMKSGNQRKATRKLSLISNVRVPVTGYAKKQFELKDNHPLMVMVNIAAFYKYLSNSLQTVLSLHFRSWINDLTSLNRGFRFG